MTEEIKQGDKLEIARRITVGGEAALEEGELVVIDKVDPNPVKPQYRFVVKSPAIGKRLQLREEDFRRPAGEGEAMAEPAETADASAESERGPGPGPRAPGFLARRRRLVLAVLAALLAALAVALALVFLSGGGGADAVLTEKSAELRSVVRSAGASSTSLSSEIADAIKEAPTPEQFAPRGKAIADRYVPSFQEYSSRISAIRREVAQVKPSPDIEYSRSRLLAASDAYGKAMLGYVTALEQLSEGQVAEATRTLVEVKRLVDNGNQLMDI